MQFISCHQKLVSDQNCHPVVVDEEGKDLMQLAADISWKVGAGRSSDRFSFEMQKVPFQFEFSLKLGK